MDLLAYLSVNWHQALIENNYIHYGLTLIDLHFPIVAFVLLLLASLIILFHRERYIKTKEQPHIYISISSLFIVISLLLLALSVLSLLIQNATLLLMVVSVIAVDYVYFRTEFRRANSKRIKELSPTDNLKFATTDKGGYWANAINGPVIVPFNKKSKNFYSEWLVIQSNHIIVNPGFYTLNDNKISYDFNQTRTYAWNGCTPKGRFLWFLVGTPDLWQTITGFKTIKSNQITHAQEKWKAAYRASLVHDALYQYLKCIPIDKKDVDLLFYQHLREDNVPHWLATIYYYAVRIGGGRGIKQQEDIPEYSCDSFRGIVFESPLNIING